MPEETDARFTRRVRGTLTHRAAVAAVAVASAAALAMTFAGAVHAAPGGAPGQGGAAQGRATAPPREGTVRGKAGGHTFSVTLARRAFRRAEHKVAPTPGGPDGYPYLVDGRPAIGTDGGVPSEELYRFEVSVDGRRWPVPERLWRDCYQPNLDTRDPDGLGADLSAWLSADGKRLTVKMLGSDGAGSYRALWHLRADGRHTREIQQPLE